MILTINLDDDLYQIAQDVAQKERLSISDAVNRLFRSIKPSQAEPEEDTSDVPPGTIYYKGRRRIPVVKCPPGMVITDEDAARIMEEEDAHDLTAFYERAKS